LKLKRKVLSTVAALGALLAVLSMTSCASVKGKWAEIKTEYALLRQEWDEIREFFGERQWSTEASQYAVIDTQDAEVAPMLGMTPHTELLDSPYNSKDSVAILKAVGDADGGLTLRGSAVSDAERYGYTSVPYFTDYGEDAVLSALASAGISARVKTVDSPAPAGEVFAISYAGISDSEGFYINPSVKVTLYVSGEKVAPVASKGDGLVYLTFDDGPSAKTTLALLDILDTYGVKATFFTLGSAVEKNPDIAKNIIDRGHSIGCHSFTHVYEDIYVSQGALENEVILWEKAVKAAGVDLEGMEKLFRFPGGSVGGKLELDMLDTMMNMLSWHGYTVFDWGVTINDAMLHTAEDGVGSYDHVKESFISSLNQRIKTNKREGGGPIIILMHENVDETVALLPWIIEYLIDEGYTFGDLADYGESWVFERDMK